MSHWVRFALFALLSIMLLGLVPLIDLVAGGGLMDFAAQAGRASEATGVLWTSNLVNLIRLALVEPGLWLLVLGSFVPTMAGLIVLTVFWSPDARQRFTQRLHPLGIDRVNLTAGLGHYALIVLVMLAGLGAVALLRQQIGGPYIWAVEIASLGFWPAIIAAAFLDQGAVLEEPGWRGVGQPILIESGVSPLLAAVVIGVLWGVWHVPRDIFAAVPSELGIAIYLGVYLPSFLAGTISTSVIAMCFMNRLGGALLPAVMVHGLANDAMGISGLTTIEVALTPGHQITKAIPFVAIAIVIIVLTGRRLGAVNPSPPPSDS